MAPDGLVNHWTNLPEWRRGRRLWVFYITFAGQPDLHNLVRRYQDQLFDLQELDLVDTRWLHITIQGIAFTDQLAENQIDAIHREAIGAVRRHSIPTLTVDRPEFDYDAISLQVLPTENIHALRDDLRDCVTRTVGADKLYRLPEPQNGFNPHVSIAYANTDIPNTDEISDRLDRVGPPDIAIRVPHVSLIHLGREDRRWFWDHERSLSFQSVGA